MLSTRTGLQWQEQGWHVQVEVERANVNARALLPTCTCTAQLDKLKYDLFDFTSLYKHNMISFIFFQRPTISFKPMPNQDLYEH